MGGSAGKCKAKVRHTRRRLDTGRGQAGRGGCPTHPPCPPTHPDSPHAVAEGCIDLELVRLADALAAALLQGWGGRWGGRACTSERRVRVLSRTKAQAPAGKLTAHNPTSTSWLILLPMPSPALSAAPPALPPTLHTALPTPRPHLCQQLVLGEAERGEAAHQVLVRQLARLLEVAVAQRRRRVDCSADAGAARVRGD